MDTQTTAENPPARISGSKPQGRPKAGIKPGPFKGVVPAIRA